MGNPRNRGFPCQTLDRDKIVETFCPQCPPSTQLWGESATVTPEDQLQSYTQTGDEQAFAKVVEAYASLVYGTAFRRTRNAPLSEEITQNVFVTLARKAARLDQKNSLGGWLHRAALLESKNALRSEAARQRRMEAMKTQQMPPDHQCEILHEEIDEALDRLSSSDRQVVLLRFFEGREFEEIGSRLGKSAAAVQKQIRRALTKLHRTLTARGATLALSGLGLALASEFARAKPLATTASLTAKAIAGAGTAQSSTSAVTAILSTMSSIKPTTAALSIAALCSIPLVSQQMAISDANRELSTLRAREDASSRAPASSAASAKPRFPVHEFMATTQLPLTGERLFHQLQTALSSGDVASLVRLYLPLTDMNEEQIQTLLDELEATPGSPGYKNIAFRTLSKYTKESKDNPGPLLSRQLANGMIPHNLTRDLSKWVVRDPKAALAWFQQARQDGKLLGTGVHSSPELHLGKALAKELAPIDSKAAFALADEVDPEFRDDILASVIGALVSSPEADPQELLGALNEPSQKVIHAAVESLAESGQRERIDGLLDSFPLPFDHEATALALAVAANQHHNDVPNRMEWLLEMASGKARNKAVGRAVSRLIRQEPNPTIAWIDTLPKGDVRDAALASEAVAIMQEGQYARAYERAGMISALQERWMTRQAVMENWRRKDPEAAGNAARKKEEKAP